MRPQGWKVELPQSVAVTLPVLAGALTPECNRTTPNANPMRFSPECTAGEVPAGVVQIITFLRHGSIMALVDSPCTLLVSSWLGEVVGASLAMG